jgi:3-oxoacyl-[acyl-carrier-protein] synthase II
MKRVVITGLGIVSPLGIGIEKNWKKLIQGECGIRSLKGRNKGLYDELPSTIAGIVPEEDLQLNNNKNILVRA